MTKLQLLLRDAVLLLCLILVTQVNAFADNPSGTNPQNPPTLKMTAGDTNQGKALEKKGSKKPLSTSDSKVERDFDKIRKFQSYDPATDKWSIIEAFDTVELLEDTTQQREEHYIYHNFWAYDALTEQWYKVDIRDYGYKLGMPKELVEAAASNDQVPAKEEKKPIKFWKNLALSFRIGPGTTFYQNKINNMRLEERRGKFYLQTKEEIGKSKGGAYLIRWFGDVHEYESNFNEGSPANIKEVALGKEIILTGQGWNLPITLATHYTFFERLRIGGGYGLEVNYLKELKPKGDATGKVNTLTIEKKYRWFYNTKWFGLIALQVMHKPSYDIIIDFQAGKTYNAGTHLKAMLIKGKYICQGIFLSAGVAYERKLNDYLRLLSRFSGNFRTYKDGPFGEQSAFVDLKQLALHLEIGLNLSFGKNTERHDEDTERLEDTPEKSLEQPKGALRQNKSSFEKGTNSLRKTR